MKVFPRILCPSARGRTACGWTPGCVFALGLHIRWVGDLSALMKENPAPAQQMAFQPPAPTSSGTEHCRWKKAIFRPLYLNVTHTGQVVALGPHRPVSRPCRASQGNWRELTLAAPLGWGVGT